MNGTGRKERDAAIVLRLPIRDWLAVTEDPTYPTVFQQLDTDPAEALVQQVWLDRRRPRRLPRPGCFDRDRALAEQPPGVSKLVDYVT